jgi:hypothetical protein
LSNLISKSLEITDAMDRKNYLSFLNDWAIKTIDNKMLLIIKPLAGGLDSHRPAPPITTSPGPPQPVNKHAHVLFP